MELDFITAKEIINGYIVARERETEALRLIVGKLDDAVVQINAEVDTRVAPIQEELDSVKAERDALKAEKDAPIGEIIP